MSPSHIHFHYVTGMICLAVGLAVQSGCQNQTNRPELVTGENATSETPVEVQPLELPTKPHTRTEVASSARPEFVNATFEAPLRLMVGNLPLNSGAKQMYPSPSLFDVDSDGQSELIVGDIFGSLSVYENQNDGSGDPVWSSHTALASAGGEAIKVSNW